MIKRLRYRLPPPLMKHINHFAQLAFVTAVFYLIAYFIAWTLTDDPAQNAFNVLVFILVALKVEKAINEIEDKEDGLEWQVVEWSDDIPPQLRYKDGVGFNLFTETKKGNKAEQIKFLQDCAKKLNK